MEFSIFPAPVHVRDTLAHASPELLVFLFHTPRLPQVYVSRTSGMLLLLHLCTGGHLPWGHDMQQTQEVQHRLDKALKGGSAHPIPLVTGKVEACLSRVF